MTILHDPEAGKLIPLDKVREALGKDPKIEIFHEKYAKVKALEGYNCLITQKAHREGKTEQLTEFFCYSDQINYDEISGLAVPPQVVIKDQLGLEDDVVSLHLGLILPKTLHLQDIALQNPYADVRKPLLPFQIYPSLGQGIFEETLSNLERYARSHGIEEITGTAAHEMQKDIFLRKGFELDTREKDLLFYAEMNDMGWPIVWRL